MFEVVPLDKSKHCSGSLIKIDYGPYEAHGIITHRIHRLRGLINHLTNLRYDFELQAVNLLNRVEIIIHKRKIFQCDIRNLKFNMDSEDDTVCLRAVSAIEEALNRMQICSAEQYQVKGVKTVELFNMPDTSTSKHFESIVSTSEPILEEGDVEVEEQTNDQLIKEEVNVEVEKQTNNQLITEEINVEVEKQTNNQLITEDGNVKVEKEINEQLITEDEVEIKFIEDMEKETEDEKQPADEKEQLEK